MTAEHRILVTRFILFFLASAGALVTDAWGDVVQVGGTYSGEITLSLETAGTFSILIDMSQETSGVSLQPGMDNEFNGTLTLLGYPKNWQISISSDTGGYMAERDTGYGDSEYVDNGKRLENPLIVKVLGKDIDISKGGAISYMDVKGGLNDNDRLVIPVTFSQRVTFNDNVLPSGRAYSILVTLTGSETF